MLENLMQAGCFVSIILLGYVLRRTGFLKEDAFPLLSRIVLKITLPAAIISNFTGKTLDISLLSLVLVGMGVNVVYLLVAYLLNRRKAKQMQAFEMLNLSGYNIGNFIMPFVQSFMGAAGVITASIFDIGCSMFSLGGSFSIASLVKDNQRFSFKRFAKTLFAALAFDAYIIMTILALLNIRLPAFVVTLSDVVGRSNVFLSMLMLGVGLRIPNDRSQMGKIAKILLLRYGIAIVLALATYFLLPFPLQVRQTILLLLFAPIAAAAPAFTNELGCDVGLASAINSASVICSTVFIVILVSVML